MNNLVQEGAVQEAVDTDESNDVLKLRSYEILNSTRPFKARGFKLKRCERCLLAKALCVCQEAVPVAIDSRFLLIMYKGESIKPSNTGRLIAEILPSTKAFLWDRLQIADDLIAAIKDEDYQSFVVFPQMYADSGRQVFTESQITSDRLICLTSIDQHTKPKQFIILDGTWSEAKKMFRKSLYLADLPMLSLDEIDAQPYLLREASRSEQLGTVSVALSILKLFDEQIAYRHLLDYTKVFIRRYLSSKARNPQNIDKLIHLDMTQ